MAKPMSERSRHIRHKVERELERKKAQHKLEMLRKRIELARGGMRAFEGKNYSESAKAFLTYIRILEDWKKVAANTLNPAHFDLKADAAELLLISSVYWHLVKLYDKGGTKQSDQDFRHYMQQFIMFSKGMPFQPLAAETLRKYMRGSDLSHMADFKAAYQTLTGSKCYVATSLIDVVDVGTIMRLQTFRDQFLLKRFWGRTLVASYYFFGPTLARVTDVLPAFFRRRIARSLDRVGNALEQGIKKLEN